MKKITVTKGEGIAEVIDSILQSPDKDVTLVIPKGSALGKSVSNFHLLRREADAGGKNITIESVDDGILALAKDSKIASNHPLWSGVRSGGLSDIVPKDSVAEESSVYDEEHEHEEDHEHDERAHHSTHSHKGMRGAVLPDDDDGDEESEDDDDMEGGGMDTGMKKIRSKKTAWIVGIVVAVVLVLYVIGAFFSHADITISFKKTPWTYSGNFIADKSVSAFSASGASTNMIPAQVFTVQKNTTETFPASSFADVSTKAQGTITIYNDYSTAPQDLVVKTRFATPDGKVFRITSNVTVPGAKSVNGKLTASSIDAPIVADQPGADYNLGPVPHLFISGFQGSPKYTGFYGAIAGTTTGGGTGKKAVPTAADIAAAKTKTTDHLQSSLQGSLAGSYPNNFKILDGATAIQVTKLTVNTSTDANGNFSVFGEASMQAIGFDESALKDYLLTIAGGNGANLVFSPEVAPNYTGVTANLSKGQVSFVLAAQGDLQPQFSPDQFAASVAGKSISTAKDAISSLPSLATGEISVWPFWLWNLPSDIKKVHVTVN